MEWEITVSQWKQTLRSDYTKHSFGMAIRVFYGWAGDAEMSRDLLESYVLYLVDRTKPVRKIAERQITPGTLNKYLLALKLYLRFCIRQGWITALTGDELEDVLKKWPSSVTRHYEILSQEEIGRLLSATKSPRDKCMLALGLFAGLRNMEIRNLRAADIGHDSEGPYVQVNQGKGNKSAIVPIDYSLYDLMKGYIDGRAPAAQLWLLSGYRLGEIVKETARRAGITRRITTHSLRHTFAYWLFRSGAPMPVIMKMLRHNDLAITTVYISHLSREETARFAPAVPS